MNDAIQVSNLSKQYRIGEGLPYQTLRDTLMGGFRRLRRSRKPKPTIWALMDVSFEIPHGRAVGIIGRNGAGKSTLLKILSRITAPTRGTVDLYGRVGSLLEVGTGFHHELTGRENIYLNGAILGMHRHEIERKFDEIVAFADVERFIDTPVKFYSTGMYMRLAFAVAAHLESEILLVDEVLAVGDAVFQKKCLGKMGAIAGQGRTVLFVSHQMNAVQEMCSECLWLDQGQLVERGPTNQVVSHYLSSGLSDSLWLAPEPSPLENAYFAPTRFSIVDQHLNPVPREIQGGDGFGVLIEGLAEKLNVALMIGFMVYGSGGELLFQTFHTDASQEAWPPVEIGKNTLVAWIPAHFLNEGSYRIELNISLYWQEWICQPGVNSPALSVEIRGGLSQSPYWMNARPGLLAPHIRFERV